MFDFFNTTEKLSRGIKKILKPRKEFTEQTRTAFMAVFDAAHPEARAAHHITAFAKTFIAGGALVAIFAGMSVYADTANVAADSTLYPLKRLSENVRLVLTPAAEKPQLQATFAVRRAAEISDLSTRKPTSTIIAGLDQSLDTDIDNSISAAVAAQLNDGNLNSFCGKVLSAIATSSVALHGQLSIHPRVLTHFEGECTVSENTTTTTTTTTVINIGGNINGSASTTMSGVGRPDRNGGRTNHVTTGTNSAPVFTLPGIVSTSTASSTMGFNASTTFHVRGGGFLNIIFGNPAHEPTSTIDIASTTKPRSGFLRNGGRGSR